MTYSEWLKRQQQAWLSEARTLVAAMQETRRTYRKMMNEEENPEHKDWFRQRIEDAGERIEIIERQHKRLTAFLAGHGIEMPDLVFEE